MGVETDLHTNQKQNNAEDYAARDRKQSNAEDYAARDQKQNNAEDYAAIDQKQSAAEDYAAIDQKQSAAEDNTVRHDTAFYRQYFTVMSNQLCPGKIEGKEALVDLLAGSASTHRYFSREFIIVQGAPQHNLYCLLSGVVRCYTIQGLSSRATTNSIITEPYTIGIASTTMEDGKPASDYLQALEDTQMITVPLKALHAAQPLPAYHMIMAARMEQSFQWYSEVMHVRTLAAQERCLWLYQKHPELAQRVEKQYLASLLDMDRAVYSRCLKKLGL